MPTKTDIKQSLGKLNPFNWRPKSVSVAPAGTPATAANTTATGPVEGEKTILADHLGSFGPGEELTPEQIINRNYAILATVKHDTPFHEHVLSVIKETWRIIGPMAFIVFTAGEVYYYLKHFMPDDQSLWTQVLLWGITLLIEVPFCISTYDLSNRKRRAVEAKAEGRDTPDKDTAGAVGMWAGMASVNITGQVAFMVLVTRVASMSGASATPIYLFIFMRVLGVLLGDGYTAFFLLPPENTISQVLKIQKAQAVGFKALSESDAEMRTIKQRVAIDIKRNQLALRRETREADFMHEFAELNMRQALANQRKLLEGHEDLPQLDEPRTGDL